jgi:hypothetical protein
MMNRESDKIFSSSGYPQPSPEWDKCPLCGVWADTRATDAQIAEANVINGCTDLARCWIADQVVKRGLKDKP